MEILGCFLSFFVVVGALLAFLALAIAASSVVALLGYVLIRLLVATVNRMGIRPSHTLAAATDKGKILVCGWCGRLNSPTRTGCKRCQMPLSIGTFDTPTSTPPVVKRSVRYGSYIKCPYCNQMVAADARHCSNCRRALNEVVMPLRLYRPGFEEKGEVLVCIRCGRLNAPIRRECKTCHTLLEKSAPPRHFKGLTED